MRRHHDQDKSDWWVLVSLIPYLGLGWAVFPMLQPSARGPNRFAGDPRHHWDGDLFE